MQQPTSEQPRRAEPFLDQAVAADLASVEELLRQAHLPTGGLADQFPQAYVLARAGGLVLGVAGLETYGEFGLLRSVAVRTDYQREGWGRRLVEDRLHHAREGGLTRVYLLTTTAARYFCRLGFEPAVRARAPDALARSPEFSSICPASSVCLSLALR
jgi:amino-acid N-acetyltransferase